MVDLFKMFISSKCFFTILFAILFFNGDAQKSDFIFEQFTTVDGLPSNECHEVFQDSDGYIWIASDNGLSRFDGKTFKNYGTKEGLGQKVIFEIVEDSLSRLWVSGLGRSIYFSDSTKTTFYPYEYNDKLINFFQDPHIDKFYFSKDTLIINSSYDGLIKIDSKGNSYKLTTKKKANKETIVLQDYQNDIIVNSRDYRLLPSVSLYLTDLDTLIKCEEKVIQRRYVRAEKINSDISVYAIFNEIFIKKGKKILKPLKGMVTEITKIKNGFALCFIQNTGVKIYRNENFDNPLVLIDQVSATGLIEDRKQGYWITTLNKGIFYIKNTGVKFAHQGSIEKQYNNIENYNDKIFACSNNGEIHQLDKLNLNTVYKQNFAEFNFFDVDTIKNNLWFSYIGKVKNLNSTISFTGTGGRKCFHFEEKGFWNLNRKGRAYFSNYKTGLKTGYFDPLDSVNLNNPNDLLVFDSIMYVGALDGLYYKKLGIFESYKNIEKLNNVRIERIILGTNNELILGTKNKGIAILNSFDSIDYIRQKDGLISDDIENLYLDSDGALWVSSLAGISKIVNFNSDESVIYNLTISHGLSCPDVYDIAELEGKMYAATGNGILKIEKELQRSSIISKPIIDEIKVNNITRDFTQNFKLSYDENLIRIDYTTLNYRHSDKMIHRYRINDEEWNLTNENYLLLPNLSPANYKLEIQSQNEDNIWSESSKLSFTIKKPWWRTYLFLSLLILGIALIVFSIVRTRLKSSEEKNKLLQEINQLEKSALSAQMSPHFIFNCLNSIQKYIMYKDKREAMEYLATFSGLIRMYLKASANDHISLAEEIKMLTHYLELEKLRFNSSFNFEIKTPPNSNFSSIKIPTMLIQPFVENAVLHGMKDKVDNNGSILVDIKREINFLHVLIEDNGQGIEHTKTEKNHDSMGMSITQKRLALIQDKSLVKDAFEIISTEEGTSIKIKIPFVEE